MLSAHHGRAVHFLVTLKHCRKCDIVAGIFKIKPPTFQTMMLSYGTVLSPYIYERFVMSAADKFTVKALVLGVMLFPIIPVPDTSQI
ncbi:hypothetical protein PHMEG_0005972 [Phytophthora megakarya]|uniref:Uncharacterized protein n=1 Tax=Phytophthora megakarya TaxID=4795 RepID=A0A225WPV5_9STRA|nr:hypothetical protein PHMEG_0005972 [Phytophthora megakarya]